MADTPEFKAAAQDVRDLAKTPANEEFAKLYSLYKQATAGDCNIDKPGATDVLGQAKFDAWNSKKGMSKDDAAAAYIEGAKEAKAKYGVKS